MSEDPNNPSQMLFDSAANVMRSAQNLDTLFSSLYDILSTTDFGGRNEDDSGSDSSAGNDWITPVYSANILVKQLGRGNRPPRGRITYLVRLSGVEDDDRALDWPWQSHACVIVGWHHGAKHSWAPEDFEPSQRGSIHHIGNGIWGWGNGPQTVANGYFFVLPLFALRSDNDLRRLVAQPLRALFVAEDPRTVAAEALADVPVLGPMSV